MGQRGRHRLLHEHPPRQGRGQEFRPDNPLLPNHEWEQRSVLEDGDTVILCGACVAPGAWRIGFGECRGTVLPAQ